MTVRLEIQAMLLDLDGTLVDTTGRVERAWRHTAEQLGVLYSVVEPFIHGIPAPQAIQMAVPDLSVAERDQLAAEMLRMEAADTVGVTANPGARQLLRQLAPDRWAIVTSGDRDVALSSLRAAELPVPAVLITADDVPTGKPDPLPFTLAARRMGAPPERCLAVEDSAAGIASARAAGVLALAVAARGETLSDAAWSVPNLESIRVLSSTTSPDAIEVAIDVERPSRRPTALHRRIPKSNSAADSTT